MRTQKTHRNWGPLVLALGVIDGVSSINTLRDDNVSADVNSMHMSRK
jgi:hypothetical protein